MKHFDWKKWGWLRPLLEWVAGWATPGATSSAVATAIAWTTWASTENATDIRSHSTHRGTKLASIRSKTQFGNHSEISTHLTIKQRQFLHNRCHSCKFVLNSVLQLKYYTNLLRTQSLSYTCLSVKLDRNDIFGRYVIL